MLTFVLLAGLSIPLKATHIVGGEIDYKCLGNNQFEITLSVYRDCYYGAENAPFDDPASVGVYGMRNGDTTLIEDLRIPFMKDDTLNALFLDECLIIPPDICVHTTMYRDTVTLNADDFSEYIFVYQRCCRNETVNNIINPVATGATYFVKLSQKAMQECNTSPVFKEWPPIFICVGKPIYYDHSAVDADGDSLVYSLCTPSQGGTLGQPMPQPPPQPPYQDVIFADGYSTENLLGGTMNPLHISDEGFLTGFPEFQGQYVVGVCVAEYRNGELLSMIKRDFQYNVGICGEVTSSIFANSAQCDNLTVEFQNKSENSDEFLWFFDWPNNMSATSNEINPTYTFPDVGQYTVALIAEPGSICADTSYHSIYLQYNSLFPDFATEAYNCMDSSVVRVVDNSYDTISDIVSWMWELNIGGDIFTSSEQAPVFTVPTFQTGSLMLTVKSQNECEQSLEKNVINPSNIFIDTLYACEGDFINLNPNSITDDTIGFTYEWIPNYNLDNPFSPNPLAEVDSSLTYMVHVETGTCVFTIDVSVVSIPFPSLDDLADTLVVCQGDSIEMNPNGSQEYTYQWSPSEGLSDPASFNPTASPIGTTTYTVTIANTYADSTCAVTKEVLVVVPPPIGLQVVNSDIITCATQVTLTANIEEAATLNWYNSAGGDVGTGETVEVPVSGTGTDAYIVRAEDAFGCMEEDSATVVPGTLDLILPADQIICQGEPINISVVNQNPTHELTYSWTPSGGILSGANTANPEFSDEVGMRTYVVTIGSQYDECGITDTVDLIIYDPNMQFSFETLLQCDGATVEFTNTSTNAFGYVWYFGDSQHPNSTSTLENPIYNYTEPGTYTVTLTTIHDVSCADTFSLELNIAEQNLVADFNYELVSCFADSAVITFTDLSVNSFNNALEWSWDFGNGMTSTEQNPVISITESQELTVTLAILSENDCEASVTKTMNFELVTIDMDQSITLCPGDTVHMNPNGNPEYDYLWIPATGLSSDTIANPLAYPDETTTYTVLLRNYSADTCEVQLEVTVFVPDEIQLEVPNDITTCGEDAILSVTSNVEATYQWYDSQGTPVGEGAEVSVNPPATETYTAVTTDQYGCSEESEEVSVTNNEVNITIVEPAITVCQDISIQLNVVNDDPNDILTYSWTTDGPGEILDGADTATPTVSVDQDGTTIYTVFVQNQYECNVEEQVSVNVLDFDVNIPETLTVCSDEPTEISPGADPTYTYEWSPTTYLDLTNPHNPIVTTSEPITYFVVVTDPATNCTAEKEVVVMVYPLLTLEVSGDTAICEDISELTLSASTNLSAEIVWSLDPDFNESFATGGEVVVNPDGATTYYVQATDDNGCTQVETIQVSEFHLAVELPGSYAMCLGESISLEVTNLDPEQTLTYLWSPLAYIENGGDTATPTVNPPVTTTFTVAIENQIGCRDTLSAVVEVIDLTIVTISADPETIYLGQESQLNVTEIEGATYDWSPSGSLSNPSIHNPIATPEETTTYTVTVIIEEGDETCEVELSIEVIVNDPICAEPYIFVPSAFTPNGDGQNDILFVRSIFLEEMEFYIYNRWGERVFQTKDINQGWDGRFEGKDLSPDVYGYYLRVKCIGVEEEYFKKGNISLLR